MERVDSSWSEFLHHKYLAIVQGWLRYWAPSHWKAVSNTPVLVQFKHLHHFLRTELQLWSEGEALSRAVSQNDGGSGRIRRRAPVSGGSRLEGARSLVRIWTVPDGRDCEAADQQIHGRKQGFQKADGAEGGASVGGEVHLVGIWAGGDQSFLVLMWNTVEEVKI